MMSPGVPLTFHHLQEYEALEGRNPKVFSVTVAKLLNDTRENSSPVDKPWAGSLRPAHWPVPASLSLPEDLLSHFH